ncbi:MAG: MBL fold metallo-hydrolase, partial [Chloroflexota bacterium]
QEADVVPADEIYNEGDIITLSGMPFEVITLPGHAPDCLGYYQPDTRVLIGADAMWENDLGVLHTAVHGPTILDDAEMAVRKIMTLNPAVVIPGHGNLITNVQENGEMILKRLSSFRNDPSKAAWHITRRFVMFGILSLQPVSREKYVSIAISDGWINAYLRDLNLGQEKQYSPENIEQLFHDLVDQFISRRLVIENNGILAASIV